MSKIQNFLLFSILTLLLLPAPILAADVANVAIYVGGGAKSESILPLFRAVSAAKYTVSGINQDDIRYGRLTESNFDVLILPPGEDGLQDTYADATYGLGDTTIISNILTFVAGGGGFIGIEAGAHFASADGSLVLYGGRYETSSQSEGAYSYTIEDPSSGSGTQDIYISSTGGWFPPTTTYPDTYPSNSITVLSNAYGSRSALRSEYGSGNVVLTAPNPTLRGDSNLDWSQWDNWAMAGTHSNSEGAWDLFGSMLRIASDGATGNGYIPSVDDLSGRQVAVVASHNQNGGLTAAGDRQGDTGQRPHSPCHPLRRYHGHTKSSDHR